MAGCGVAGLSRCGSHREGRRAKGAREGVCGRRVWGGLLRDDGERGTVLLQRQLRHLDAADEDGAAALWRRDELCDRGEQARLA